MKRKKRKGVIPLGFVAWRGGEADLEARRVAGDGGSSDADELAWKNWYFVSCFYGFMMNTENLAYLFLNTSFPLPLAYLL